MNQNLNEVVLQCKSFEDLNAIELYKILQLRQEVFVVEQDCPYLDCDDKDQNSWHITAYIDDELIAYTRILTKGISYKEYSSIGRVVSKINYRKSGIGSRIMIYSIEKLKELDPDSDIKISSQVYIMSFYERLGFQAVGEEYLEDDIPHHAMVLYVKE